MPQIRLSLRPPENAIINQLSREWKLNKEETIIRIVLEYSEKKGLAQKESQAEDSFDEEEFDDTTDDDKEEPAEAPEESPEEPKEDAGEFDEFF